MQFSGYISMRTLSEQIRASFENLALARPECEDIKRGIREDSSTETTQLVDPLRDYRWEELVQRHPQASIFHSKAWLSALAKTYGYTPVVYTTSPKQQMLRDGIVFCRVESRLTGRRLVCLPFSDYCEPLVDTQ